MSYGDRRTTAGKRVRGGTHGVDEPRRLKDGEQNPPMGSGPSKEEVRIERAVLEAMDKAARAGLGHRGRIRAGQRAMASEKRRIEKERGR